MNFVLHFARNSAAAALNKPETNIYTIDIPDMILQCLINAFIPSNPEPTP